ncbi:conserved hypothetical protein [Vibrio nigripulchritudo MADA3029]|uniref:BtrH N-terminal domain-containing protein n=1 Tax=Vibrio nigripulchritudo TaxID=28173 RepID=UPI0003B1C4A1|nr:BtrH N-terminal domain-containing protein [Vibrio nigripulchritudo]CCN49151.1 conserved hypothetical protein [Vibrio nigripulchritudo MADA3020]CCN55725.1 conserved hypothetical protein [Vibrio nigripulchritudo MADA3021]CCN59578.1 conserved hypothetical protein [Vibrio nigripulchritudo MADA3029]
MAILTPFESFDGVHCETNTIGNLLKHIDIELSEPMLFGLGEGLGYIYWNMKGMDFPFIGGRTKPAEITQRLAKNLDLNVEFKETGSTKKAWKNVQQALESGSAVGLQLDCYHLDYFGAKVHFAGHFAAMYGFDDDFAYMIDTQPKHGKVKCTLSNLEKARNEKGPMSAKNRMFTISASGKPLKIDEVLRVAITNNANTHLSPPIKNFGYQGILKTSHELKKWFRQSDNLEYEFTTTAMLMEKAGTGGAIFRNLYRDFLLEAYERTGIAAIKDAHNAFKSIAENWTEVSYHIDNAGREKDENSLLKACSILEQLSDMEFRVMNDLKDVFKGD